MIPVWIIGSNVDTSSPLVNPSEKLEQEAEERKKRNEDRDLNKHNSETFDKISTNIRGLVRGFTSLFKGGTGNSSSVTSAGSSSSSGVLSGDSNQAKTWNFFKSKGLSDEAVAGIMGNIEQESRFQTNASESGDNTRDGSGGYGLIQWTGSRRQKLFDAASSQGKDVNDLEFQLNYLWDEALSSGYYKDALDRKGFFTSTDVADTTLSFHNIVEGSADSLSMIQNNRVKPAQNYYNQFKGTSAGSTTTNTSSTGSSINLSTGNTTSSTGSSAIDKAVAWAVQIANDDSHGYDQGNRWSPDYDCSSLIISAYEQAGIPVKSNGATYTGNMESVFTSLGFTDVTSETSHGTNISALRKGDVLLNPASHVEMYIGNNQKVGAHSNEFGGITGGATGDQTGKEIDVGPMSGSWDIVLRPPGTFTEGSVVDSQNNASSGSLLGGLGIFDSTYAITDDEKAQVEAEQYWKDLRDSGGHAYNSRHNDTAKGENKATVITTNTSGWKSDYNKTMEELANFNQSRVTYDPSKSNNGKSPYEIIKNNNDSSSIIYNPSSVTTSGDGTSTGGNTGGNSSATNPSKPDDISDEHKKYYEKLVELLGLIEKNTSNIPVTNKLLNEIIKLLDDNCCSDENNKDNSNSDTKEPNTNIMESLFGTIDSDINLIATGI